METQKEMTQVNPQNAEQVTRKEFDSLKYCNIVISVVSISLAALALLMNVFLSEEVGKRLISLKDKTVALKADIEFRDTVTRLNNSKIDRMHDFFDSYDDKYISKQDLINAGVAHYICDPVT
jgi:hypothetical protein